jgi:hypothetical protein
MLVISAVLIDLTAPGFVPKRKRRQAVAPVVHAQVGLFCRVALGIRERVEAVVVVGNLVLVVEIRDAELDNPRVASPTRPAEVGLADVGHDIAACRARRGWQSRLLLSPQPSSLI